MLSKVALLLFLCVFASLPCVGQAIVVHEVVGTSRAFLVIRDEGGDIIGRGTFVQSTHGSHVFSKLSLNFHDGSVDEDTSHFIQARTFRLIDDHHVQNGPSFPKPIDVAINASGNITTKTTDSGKIKVETSHIDLPPDVANGMLAPAMLNLASRNGEERTISFIAPAGKGRLIHLKVTHDRLDKFTIAGGTVAADVYRVHYDLGGVVGVVAPLVGKQPADTMVWLTHGVPSLVREQGALYDGGPVLSLELAGASFEKNATSPK